MDTSAIINTSADTMNYALQVALQTMKERCIQLQRRLTTVEEENQNLRKGMDNNRTNGTTSANGGAAENLQLRLQVTELQRQKTRLTEHINMVSDENRKLWSRLSQMSKEQLPNVNRDKDGDVIDIRSPSDAGVGANQNLIRSKTFTQHSPNPHLRQKLLSDDLKDISLEEITLNDIGAGEAFAEEDEVELGYPYIEVDATATTSTTTASDIDSNVDAKRCMEGLQELRREAMKQQQELMLTLNTLETHMALQPCPDCAKKAQKPEMADKSLETDESLNEPKNYMVDKKISQQPTVDTTVQNGHLRLTNTTPTVPTVARLNILQEKINADALDKTCPMCGKIYSSHISFKAFQEHVELHFIDDSVELETSIEHNFELISHSVGDF